MTATEEVLERVAQNLTEIEILQGETRKSIERCENRPMPKPREKVGSSS